MFNTFKYSKFSLFNYPSIFTFYKFSEAKIWNVKLTFLHSGRMTIVDYLKLYIFNSDACFVKIQKLATLPSICW